jgi:hypothetical protein
MPVLTHETHASVVKTNPRYGCNSRAPFKDGYWAKAGIVIGSHLEAAIKMAWTKHTMSTACRYDGQDTDPGCAGCTAEKDAEYVGKIREEGRA